MLKTGWKHWGPFKLWKLCSKCKELYLVSRQTKYCPSCGKCGTLLDRQAARCYLGLPCNTRGHEFGD